MWVSLWHGVAIVNKQPIGRSTISIKSAATVKLGTCSTLSELCSSAALLLVHETRVLIFSAVHKAVSDFGISCTCERADWKGEAQGPSLEV